jgi:hypothetical protein
VPSRSLRRVGSRESLTQRLRIAVHLNSHLVNLAILLLGIMLVLLSFGVKSNSQASVVLISVGTSIVSTAIVSFMVGLYSVDSWLSRDELARWRLSSIYKTRAEMNRSASAALVSCRRQIDIAAFGLKGFRETQTTVVQGKVRSGVRIRILCPHPDSPFVSAREESEREVSGQIRKTILALEEWVQELQKLAINKDQVQLKYYNALPLDLYYRIDRTLYVGPYLHGYGSQQTISLEFEQPGEGFEYWEEYFDTLWHDEYFASAASRR